MLIEVDNLSEALEVTDEANRPMLAAEVEKSINSYSKKLKAMIIKYDYNIVYQYKINILMMKLIVNLVY